MCRPTRDSQTVSLRFRTLTIVAANLYLSRTHFDIYFFFIYRSLCFVSLSLGLSPRLTAVRHHSGSTTRPITFSHATGRTKLVLACALLFPKAYSLFHVNDTRAPTKASSKLRSRRRRCCCR